MRKATKTFLASTHKQWRWILWKKEKSHKSSLCLLHFGGEEGDGSWNKTGLTQKNRWLSACKRCMREQSWNMIKIYTYIYLCVYVQTHIHIYVHIYIIKMCENVYRPLLILLKDKLRHNKNFKFIWAKISSLIRQIRSGWKHYSGKS